MITLNCPMPRIVRDYDYEEGEGINVLNSYDHSQEGCGFLIGSCERLLCILALTCGRSSFTPFKDALLFLVKFNTMGLCLQYSFCLLYLRYLKQYSKFSQNLLSVLCQISFPFKGASRRSYPIEASMGLLEKAFP